MSAKIDFSKISFLVVDGDKISAQVVFDTLAYLGATHVQRVPNPQDAFQILRSQQIDVIVTEWRLRGMDGLEFLDSLRNSISSPNRFVPVIMLTAHSEEQYVTKARDLGITEFLAKPFNAKALYSRLVSVITRPRRFINTDTYFGPDRRRRQVSFDGPDRRDA
ncbi:response regulator [Thalassospira sp.]|uniref:response regulator n=1 Tax=Thalassospira sp. TaxID=1912094 RepID=UPI002735800B|nr:response regulator [Thalassospira sp.]MDP2697004.1 response regulator [Thalassospira sp.]